MSTVIRLPERGTARDQVAGQVRAELGRARLNSTKLATLLGKSQSYWSRRLTGATALDVDELEQLADLMGITVGHFFGVVSPQDDGGGAAGRPRQDSNLRPRDYLATGSDGWGGVVPLRERRANPLSRPAAAPERRAA